MDITLRGVPDDLIRWLTVRAQQSGLSRNKLILSYLAEAKRRDWTAREAPPIVVE